MVKRRWLVGAAWAVAAVLLAVAGVGALVVVAGDQQPPPPATSGSDPSSGRQVAPPRAAPQPPVEDTADRVAGQLLPESQPVRLRIPAIGVDAGVVRLGVDGAGAMEVPGDPADAGWFTGAASPGALGPAVIAAHVTWDREPAAFFRLTELRSGDRVEVVRQDGLVAVFEIRRVISVAKSRFPTREVYGPTDHAALRLITCTGRYDQDQARYDDNAVAFASLVAVRQAGTS